ncbi:uncharacterized protein F4807DRAFT_367198 [Annulohypoxylon truncatum]|uniref:uncharacterized protein n=1 Tax=Annulohypoxylon truncatum TaxID=327061 RepID=UPI0020077CE2|nr:uncharacterized protein F4807DRAFT_367198 [Annulohypoxylon truncatum]KAI1212338.1 hypothetical protein F4807DRAFT_367198 [Annulohypoxylon truncatum]
MAALKGILRKPWMDGCGAEVPAMATTTTAATMARKINVSFEDVLARDGEDGRIVPPSMRSRDEWIREVNKRRGANLIEKFRGLESEGKGDDDGDAYCQVTLVENVGDDGFGKEVVLYEATSSESDDDDESDEDTEVESESESEDGDGDEGGGAEKIEVIFGSDSEDDDDDGGDDDEEEDGDEDEKEKKEEAKGEAKKDDETKEDHMKGEKDSMEYARTFLQSEVGSHSCVIRMIIC